MLLPYGRILSLLGNIPILLPNNVTRIIDILVYVVFISNNYISLIWSFRKKR